MKTLEIDFTDQIKQMKASCGEGCECGEDCGCGGNCGEGCECDCHKSTEAKDDKKNGKDDKKNGKNGKNGKDDKKNGKDDKKNGEKDKKENGDKKLPPWLNKSEKKKSCGTTYRDYSELYKKVKGK